MVTDDAGITHYGWEHTLAITTESDGPSLPAGVGGPQLSGHGRSLNPPVPHDKIDLAEARTNLTHWQGRNKLMMCHLTECECRSMHKLIDVPFRPFE